MLQIRNDSDQPAGFGDITGQRCAPTDFHPISSPGAFGPGELKMNTTVNVLKFQTLYFILFFSLILLPMKLFLKNSSGLANSVYPDQTAPLGNFDV